MSCIYVNINQFSKKKIIIKISKVFNTANRDFLQLHNNHLFIPDQISWISFNINLFTKQKKHFTPQYAYYK